MARPRKYPPELLDRGARVVIESGRPIAHVARDLGVPSETLRKYVRQVEADEGLRPDLPTWAEREEIRALRKEVYELRRANEILKAASVFRDRARRRPTEVSRFIDEHRGPLRRRADLPGPGRVGVRLFPARPRAALEPGRLRPSGCWAGSASCTRPTTTPTATGACGRRCCGPASRSRGVGCSGSWARTGSSGPSAAAGRGGPLGLTPTRPARSCPAGLHRL